jgi:DNA invertase Pin-like site-specific DNA recombinase
MDHESAGQQVLLDFIRPGDIIVTRIDRLARSMKDLQDTVYDLTPLIGLGLSGFG